MAMGDGDDVHSDCDASDHAPLTTTAEVNEDDDGGSDDEGPDNDDEYDNDEDKFDDDYVGIQPMRQGRNRPTKSGTQNVNAVPASNPWEARGTSR